MQTPNELFLNSQSRRIKSSIFPVCFHGTSRLSGDLLDGFIPRLLREEHPDGVALKGVDRTKVSFRQWLKDIDGWIAESVPCSSSRSICRSPQEADPELVDGGERLRTEVGHAIHAPKVRWPRGWRDGRIGSWTRVFFFSFAHSEGSAFCTKRYWEVIFFFGMLCLAFHQLPPVQDMQSASERFVAKLPERVMRKGQVCNLAKR